MEGVEVEIKKESDNWNTLILPVGTKVEVGQRIYRGARTVLIEGKEVEMAEEVWGGTYNLENGTTIEVVEGVITEVNESIKELAQIRKKSYKKQPIN